MKRVLLVDDDHDLRETLSMILLRAGYTVECADNGKIATSLFQDQKDRFDLVISDIKMPVVDGVQFFQNISGIRGKTPFIMMTGFSEVMDAQKAHDMGVDEFITKPFTREELLGVIEVIFNGNKKASEESALGATAYCGVSIDDFLMGSRVASDVYLRLSENKYLLIAKSQAPLSTERLEVFKKRGLEKLYIKKEDFAKYVGFNLKLSRSATSSSKVPPEKKLSLLKHTAEVYLENSFVNGISKEEFSSGKEIMNSTISLIVESDDLFALLSMLKSQSDVTYAHSLAVGVYCSLVARKVGWNSPQTLFKISMAGLFHDIGKKELPTDLLRKNRLERTAEDVQLYESHAVRGQQILATVPNIPEEVIMAAVQHHENLTGSGYPNRMPPSRFQPISRLIALGDAFCNLVLKTEGGGEQMKAKDALDLLYRQQKDSFDPIFFRALMGLFDYPVPSDLARLQKFKETA